MRREINENTFFEKSHLFAIKKDGDDVQNPSNGRVYLCDLSFDKGTMNN